VRAIRKGDQEAGGQDAVESCGMDAEGAGDLTDGLSFLDEPIGEFSLLPVHLLGTSEAHAALFAGRRDRLRCAP
jgi:hypothetical protein